MTKRLALFSAALAMIVWALSPLWASADAPAMIRPRVLPAAATKVPERLPANVPVPIRFAHKPACNDGSPPCSHWILVSERGERWWLPSASGQDSLALSRDGTLAAYPRGKAADYVVRDLRTGRHTTVKIKGELGIGPFFGGSIVQFSLDGRHLSIPRDHLDKDDEIVIDPLVIADVKSGALHTVPLSDGSPVGWTKEGLVLADTAQDSGTPGHVSAAGYTVRSPTGRLIRRFALPGNLGTGLAVSPSGRTLATLVKEATLTDVRLTGVALLDLKGTRTGTAVPRLPAGWTIAEIVRWDGEAALIVRLRGPMDSVSFQAMDLASGKLHGFGTENADVLDLMLDPAERSIVPGLAPRTGR